MQAAGCEHCDLVPSLIIRGTCEHGDGGGQDGRSQSKVNFLLAAAEECSLCGGAAAASGSVRGSSLIRGWRDTRTSSVDTNPIQTLS